MDKPLNTKYVYEFQDGTSCEMTLAFYALYMLRSKNKDIYKRYNATMNAMAEKNYIYDELDVITILYTAYLCAKLNDFDNVMSEEEFLMKCGNDRDSIGKAMTELTTAKKTKASANHS